MWPGCSILIALYYLITQSLVLVYGMLCFGFMGFMFLASKLESETGLAAPRMCTLLKRIVKVTHST
uniref:Uncharacterized protein n=1 Tax=Solanum lycopersicum TaxID=4081 RepID=A0A3Q7GYU5_SOLLC